jgi:hypothetical protein
LPSLGERYQGGFQLEYQTKTELSQEVSATVLERIVGPEHPCGHRYSFTSRMGCAGPACVQETGTLTYFRKPGETGDAQLFPTTSFHIGEEEIAMGKTTETPDFA